MLRLSRLVLVLVLGLATAVGAQERRGERLTIRMIQPVDAFAFMSVYAALSQGYFKEDNIDVQFTIAGAGGREIAAILGGSAEIAVSSGVELYKAAAQGADLVGVLNIYDRAEVAIALHPQVAERLKFSEAMSFKERVALLKGLKIGMTAPGTLTDVMARYYVTAAGFDPNTDVQIVAVGPGVQGLAALQRATIDAFVPFPPFTQLMEQRKAGVLIFDPVVATVKDPLLEQWLEEVVVVTRAYAKKSPGDIRRVLRALLRGNQWIADHSAQEVADMLGTFPWAASLDPAVRLAAVRAMKDGVPRDGTVKAPQLENIGVILRRIGFLNKEIPASHYIDNSMLK